MKKSIIIAVSCGLVALASASKYLINKKNNDNNKSFQNEKYLKSQENIVSKTHVDLEEQKEHTASTIIKRHNVATQIIREALEENNCNRDNGNNKVDFDEIDSSLNKLLDEE